MWKKCCPPLILILLLSVCSLLAQERKVKKIFRIGVIQFNSSQASEKDQKGFEKALAEAGFKEKIHVLYDRQNAQGDLTKAQTIARKFHVEKFDLIHTIGSANSRTIVKLIDDIPVVFSSVTHPVEAGLVPKKSLPGTKTGTKVTGVTHRWPVSLQFEMYTQCLPKAKKWGTIYHPGDPHTLVLIKEMRESAKRMGMELTEAVISASEETLQASSFLVGKVQALYITYDDTVLSSIDAIVKACNEKKVPLFTSDLESVAKGAVAAYGLNFSLIGYSAGKRAARILKGEEPGNIPWGRIEKLHLVVNEKAAKAQGVILSPELLKRSDKILN
jgi:putative ABC transport system substrate-binding protein